MKHIEGTGGENFATIQKVFKRSAWVGYTGTSMFGETTQGLRTENFFGQLLHAYTIREAIADRNVLGFKDGQERAWLLR